MANTNTALTYFPRFKFLETIPYVEALRRSDDGECFICQEPYTLLNHNQKPGTPNHLPIRLPCGHLLGFQCLTRWIISKGFNNRCGLCRAEIIPKDKTQEPHTLALDLMELVVTLKGGVTPTNKEAVLYTFLALLGKRNNEDTTPLEKDRMMMLCEAFLDALARENPARRFKRFPPMRDVREVVVGVERIVPVERVREVERIVEVERMVQRAPAEPKPGRVTIPKALIFSILISLISVSATLTYIYCFAVPHSHVINLDKQSDQIALINARGSLVVMDVALQETLFYHLPNLTRGLTVVGLLLLVTTLFWGTRPDL